MWISFTFTPIRRRSPSLAPPLGVWPWGLGPWMAPGPRAVRPESKPHTIKVSCKTASLIPLWQLSYAFSSFRRGMWSGNRAKSGVPDTTERWIGESEGRYSLLLRCTPRDVGGCKQDDTECGRGPFRSERAPGAERRNGGTGDGFAGRRSYHGEFSGRGRPGKICAREVSSSRRGRGRPEHVLRGFAGRHRAGCC